jgi:hypothetical protein
MPDHKDRFTAVMDVLGDGRIGNVQVKPVNKRTTCYAERMAKVKGPPPPAKFAEQGFPVVIEMGFR